MHSEFSPNFLVPPAVVAPLDPGFRPAALTWRDYQRETATADSVELDFALERSPDSISRFKTRIPMGRPGAEHAFFTERLLKLLLWARGAHRVYFSGPLDLFEALRRYFEGNGPRRFDADILGNRIYDRPFELIRCSETELPSEKEFSQALGRNWQGARLGFDLGASDRKVAAVLDGVTLFTDETVWSPVGVKDPQWHFDEIMDSLRRAARYLPRVDAIGGSAAGVYVNNRVKIASLFRSVPPEQFDPHVKELFLKVQKAWNQVPLEIVNDGEVTALAGAMWLNANRVLGIAMGSSEAGGYVDATGSIKPWLNELAFAPIDFSPESARDEWSGDAGCGGQYLSQQGVGRLLAPAQIALPEAMTLPEKLVAVQQLAQAGDERAHRIFTTLGVYLGYALAHYANFYDVEYGLVLGRVTSGVGGQTLIEKAREVLAQEFPELSARCKIVVPDEKQKRLGQAAAAASLPR